MFRAVLAAVSTLISRFFLGMIWVYQKTFCYILGGRCRFYPSCSEYAKTCFQSRNLIFALWLVTKRLLKCQPLHPGGYDPVPPSLEK